MEFMIAWYPLAKFSLIVLLGALSGFLLTRKSSAAKYVGGILVVLILLFYVFAPVKIDGTNTHRAMTQEHQYQDSNYLYQAESLEKKTTHEPTFEEQLAHADQRANQRDTLQKKELQQ